MIISGRGLAKITSVSFHQCIFCQKERIAIRKSALSSEEEKKLRPQDVTWCLIKDKDKSHDSKDSEWRLIIYHNKDKNELKLPKPLDEKKLNEEIKIKRSQYFEHLKTSPLVFSEKDPDSELSEEELLEELLRSLLIKADLLNKDKITEEDIVKLKLIIQQDKRIQPFEEWLVQAIKLDRELVALFNYRALVENNPLQGLADSLQELETTSIPPVLKIKGLDSIFSENLQDMQNNIQDILLIDHVKVALPKFSFLSGEAESKGKVGSPKIRRKSIIEEIVSKYPIIKTRQNILDYINAIKSEKFPMAHEPAVGRDEYQFVVNNSFIVRIPSLLLHYLDKNEAKNSHGWNPPWKPDDWFIQLFTHKNSITFPVMEDQKDLPVYMVGYLTTKTTSAEDKEILDSYGTDYFIEQINSYSEEEYKVFRTSRGSMSDEVYQCVYDELSNVIQCIETYNPTLGMEQITQLSVQNKKPEKKEIQENESTLFVVKEGARIELYFNDSSSILNYDIIILDPSKPLDSIEKSLYDELAKLKIGVADNSELIQGIQQKLFRLATVTIEQKGLSSVEGEVRKYPEDRISSRAVSAIQEFYQKRHPGPS